MRATCPSCGRDLAAEGGALCALCSSGQAGPLSRGPAESRHFDAYVEALAAQAAQEIGELPAEDVRRLLAAFQGLQARAATLWATAAGEGAGSGQAKAAVAMAGAAGQVYSEEIRETLGMSVTVDAVVVGAPGATGRVLDTLRGLLPTKKEIVAVALTLLMKACADRLGLSAGSAGTHPAAINVNFGGQQTITTVVAMPAPAAPVVAPVAPVASHGPAAPAAPGTVMVPSHGAPPSGTKGQ